MLMFMRPEQAERVREIMRDYAWQQDGSELTTDKARKARFHAGLSTRRKVARRVTLLNTFPRISTATR